MQINTKYNPTLNEGCINLTNISQEKFKSICEILDICSDDKIYKTIKIIVAGSRSFGNYIKLCKELNAYISSLQSKIGFKPNITIVSGTAKGADTLGEVYARRHGYGCRRMPAQWSVYGNSAGMIRNGQMAKYANNNAYGILFAFWDGKSPGTLNMINEAKKEGLEIHIVHF